MNTSSTPLTRRRVPVLSAVALSAWAAYKLANSRGLLARKTPACGSQEPAAPGLPAHWEDWDIGTGVAGYAWHASQPRAVLLLQHGYTEHAGRYVREHNALIPRLLALGISVFAFDMWGHGRSPGTRGLVDAGRAIEDHLAARRKLAGQPLPVFALGHSLGGLVTAGSVARDPDGVCGVILTGAALLFETTPALRTFARFAAFCAPTVPLPREQVGSIPDRQLQPPADPLRYTGPLQMGTAVGIACASHDGWTRYPSWETPVLILHGTADRTTNPEGSRRFFGTIAAEDKTLQFIEGGRHELLNDAGRDQTLRIMLDWLEKRISLAR